MKIKRTYHPHWKWEENNYNMWGSVNSSDREAHLQRAIEFTGDYKLYGSWMLKVTEQWKYSCEHNLSDLSQNRRAWIGHAACALAFQCPEDIVRGAWGHLTEQQQILANREADRAIKIWEKKYLGETDAQEEIRF